MNVFHFVYWSRSRHHFKCSLKSVEYIVSVEYCFQISVATRYQYLKNWYFPVIPFLVPHINSNIVVFTVWQLCVILEPMQELMSRHKAYGLNPRDCLKTTLFQKWQRMVAPPGELNPDDPSDPRGRRSLYSRLFSHPAEPRARGHA